MGPLLEIHCNYKIDPTSSFSDDTTVTFDILPEFYLTSFTLDLESKFASNKNVNNGDRKCHKCIELRA